MVEAISTAFAVVLGALALVRFYSRKNNVFLFLGTGFLVAATLDAYHALPPGLWESSAEPGHTVRISFTNNV